MKKVLITGAAGFIGSNLADTYLAQGTQVIGVDNLSTGKKRFLSQALDRPGFKFVERDLTDPAALKDLLGPDTDWVIHLAANADVKDGWLHPRKDLEQNTIVTWNVLEQMRQAGAKRIAFSSTGSVYGESRQIPTSEEAPFPVQTSLYGASKLAGEGLIASYTHGADMKAVIFRFVSIMGNRYTHGHVIDFVRHLKRDPKVLAVLGDGSQRKSYLDVADCIAAMQHAMRLTLHAPVEIFNLGTDHYVDVNHSIDVICERLKVDPTRKYSGGDRGWVGDNPFIFLDTAKIRATGWAPTKTIDEAVRGTVDYLLANPWVLES